MANDGEGNGEGKGDERIELARLATDVVKAYLSRNVLPQSDLPQLISAVSHGLQGIGMTREEAPPAKPKPAVSVRRSIGEDQITCLVCGKAQKLLTRHLAAAHELTPAEYRERYGLKSDYPMIAPAYAKQRSEMAQRIGLGRKQPPRRRRVRRSSGASPKASAETPA